MIIKYIVPLLLLVCFISACTKISETEIGTGLIPPVDGVITKDTNITVYAKTWGSVDSLHLSLYDDHALGYVNDPLFGTTNASINVQMQPAFPFYFEVPKDSLTLDSVVMSLAVRGVWGDTTMPLQLHVKEIDNDQLFDNDSSLILYNTTKSLTATNDLTYNGSPAIVYPDQLGTDDTLRNLFQDSGVVSALRIRLSDEFGNRLLHTYDSANQYKSALLFKQAFKGFQVTADPMVGNALLKIGLANLSTVAAEPNTKLGIYYNYHSKTTAGLDSIVKAVKYFTVNTAGDSTGTAHSNHIEQNKGGQLASHYPPDTESNDDYIYLQSAPGTYATITIDPAAISKLPNWIIHRADIVMEQAVDPVTATFDNFTTPYLFMLVKPANTDPLQNDTTKFVIPGFDSSDLNTFDALFSSNLLANYTDFGGVPFRKTVNGNSINYYNFNVSRYIQGIVTKKNPQYKFTLYAPYREVFQIIKGISSYGRVSSPSSATLNSAGIGRVRLYGGGTDTTNQHRMKLHIVYSVPH